MEEKRINGNLKPFEKGGISSEEAKERGRLGGLASVESKRRKKKLKELVELFGEMPTTERMKDAMSKMGISENDMTNKMATVIGLYKKAMQGDVCAFNAIRDIMGEKPKDVIDNNFSGDVKIKYVSSGTAKFANTEDEVDV
jgi:hypothetical protein